MTATPEAASEAHSPAPPPVAADTPGAYESEPLRLSLTRLRGEIRDSIVASCSARPLRELSAPNVAGALADEVMTRVTPAVGNLWASCDRHVEVIHSWQDEVNRLTDGADGTPPAEGCRLTAGQFFHKLLAAPAEGRLMMLDRLAEHATTGVRCWAQDHAGNIEDLKRRPTLHAFDTVCASVERQRVALVAVLGLVDDTTFDEAVDAAGVLAGQGGEVATDVLNPGTADNPAALPPGTWLVGEDVYALRWFVHPETDPDEQRPWIVLDTWGNDSPNATHDRVRGWTILPGSPTFPHHQGGA